MTTEPITIYTIGHSNVEVRKLIELIQSFKEPPIRTLVDVRSTPYSKYCAQFDREAFAKKLKDKGLEYVWLGEQLGGRPKDDSCYKKRPGTEEEADYLHMVNYPEVMTRDFFLQGIQKLLETARNGGTVIMCSEEDPNMCHRHHMIGRYLIGQGMEVLHIRHDKNVVPDQQYPGLPEDPPEQLAFGF